MNCISKSWVVVVVRSDYPNWKGVNDMITSIAILLYCEANISFDISRPTCYITASVALNMGMLTTVVQIAQIKCSLKALGNLIRELVFK